MAKMSWWALAVLLGATVEVAMARAIMAIGWLAFIVFLVGCAGLWCMADVVWSLRRAHQ